MRKMALGFAPRVMIFAALATLVISFQNCSNQKLTGNSSEQSATAREGNARPYYGKTYVSTELCADGTPKTRVQAIDSNSASVLRSNCVDVVPPLSIDGSQFSVAPDAMTMLYNGETLQLEGSVQFKQTSEMYNSNPMASAVGNPFPNPVASGNLILCMIKTSVDGPTAPRATSMSDNLGNQYVKIYEHVEPLRDTYFWSHFSYDIWMASNVNGGSNLTVTAQLDRLAQYGAAISCLEYSGSSGASAFAMGLSGGGDVAGNVRLDGFNATAQGMLVGWIFDNNQVPVPAGNNFRSYSVGHTVLDRPVAPGSYSIESTASSAWLVIGILLKGQ